MCVFVEISSRHIMRVPFDIHVKTTGVPGHTIVLLESLVTSCVNVTEERERERERKREREREREREMQVELFLVYLLFTL